MRYLVELEIPFVWQRSDPTACAEAQFANSSLLAILDKHEDHPGHDNTGSDTHLQRIEAKLDLILQLLARPGSVKPLSQRQLLRLAPQRISWRSSESIPVGTVLQLQLELDSRFPQPLVFCAKVVGREAEGWLSAELNLVDAVVAEAWEHWLFRLHRRHIAKVRQT